MSDDIQTQSGELVIACNLSGEELAAREREIGTLLMSNIQQVEELTDGYALRFNGSDAWAAQLLQFIVFERECCPFFTFELLFAPNHGPIWLKLRGPEGVKAALTESLLQGIV